MSAAIGSGPINSISLLTLPSEILEHITNLDSANQTYLTLRCVNPILAQALPITVYRTIAAAKTILDLIDKDNEQEAKALFCRFLQYAPSQSVTHFWKLLKGNELKSITRLTADPSVALSLEKILTLSFDITKYRHGVAVKQAFDHILQIITRCPNLKNLSLCTPRTRNEDLPATFVASLAGKNLRGLHMPQILLSCKNLKTIVTEHQALEEAALSVVFKEEIATRLQKCVNLKGFGFEVKPSKALMGTGAFALLRHPLKTFPKLLSIHLPHLYPPLLPVEFIEELPKLVLLCQQGLVERQFRTQQEQKISASYGYTFERFSADVPKFTEFELDDVEELSTHLKALQISVKKIDLQDPPELNTDSVLDQLFIFHQPYKHLNPFVELDLILTVANPSELILIEYPDSVLYRFNKMLKILVRNARDRTKEIVAAIADEQGVVRVHSLDEYSRLKKLYLSKGCFKVGSKELQPFLSDCVIEDLKGIMHKCQCLDIEKFRETSSIL